MGRGGESTWRIPSRLFREDREVTERCNSLASFIRGTVAARGRAVRGGVGWGGGGGGGREREREKGCISPPILLGRGGSWRGGEGGWGVGRGWRWVRGSFQSVGEFHLVKSQKHAKFL